MTNYENYNSSLSSFRIFCDKLTSNDISNNLILESINNNIEFKVPINKKIIFNNNVALNNTINLNNKGLAGLTTISAESLYVNTAVLNTTINMINKSSFFNNSIYSNTFETTTTNIQDLSNALFNTIDISNNSSILVNLSITLYCSYAMYERISVELWRDASMLMQSTNLGSVNAAGGIVIPYSLTYLDNSLNAGPKKYYIKYKLENNVSLIRQGIINLQTGSDSNIILTEIENASNYNNKVQFANSSYTTTSYDIQDLSSVLYNIIDVSNSNVQITINLNIYCCYNYYERLTLEVWRDASMISQSKELEIINATNGLTIPYSFNYLDTNLSNGPKKYYLKYKLEKDPTSDTSVSAEPQGIVNISTLNSIGTSNILLANVPKNNSNLTRTGTGTGTGTTTQANSFLTSTSDLQDLSGQLYNNIEIGVPSAVFVDLNFTLYACYAANERITIQLWRNTTMVSQNVNIGTTNATGGTTINFKLSFLDESVNSGSAKYYIKYKLENNFSAQRQGIIDVQGGYTIIEDYNRGIFLYYKILSYDVMDYPNGYVTNTSIGYNPIIAGDKGAASGRRGAYFTYIDVSGADSSFNNSLYVKQNINVDGSASITSDLSVNTISLATMLSKLSLINDYINNLANTSQVPKIISISKNAYYPRGELGNSVAINDKGNIIAVGSNGRYPYTIGGGYIRIYKYNDVSWVQISQDISGYSISLNASGTIVAIGNPKYDINVSLSGGGGVVKVYKYVTDNSWIQISQNIYGITAYDYNGASVALNADGTIVAIGATGVDIGTRYSVGHVRVYKYINDTSWTQLGQTISGELYLEQLGFSVSLDTSGTILAIGSSYYESGNASLRSGKVRVYRFTNDTSWVLISQVIDSTLANGIAGGYSVSLNSNGTIVACGGIGNIYAPVLAKVYKYISDGIWIPLGDTIISEEFTTLTSTEHVSLSLNNDGTILAIGDSFNNSTITGNVRVYKYNDVSWIQITEDIKGDTPLARDGYSVALNALGNILVTGAPGGLSGSGYVKVNTIASIIDNSSRIEFSNNSIRTIDLSAANITISNELYVLNKYYANDLNISGQLLSAVLRVPQEFTIDPFGYNNPSGRLIINGNLIVRGNKKTIRSSIVDISSYTLKVASNLINKNDLANNPAGLDVSNVASLKYNGTTWNISGGNLLINNMSVGLDVSLINLQITISNSLIGSKSKYDTSFQLLQTNMDSSFNKLVYYTNTNVDNSFVRLTSAYTDFSNLKNYIDLSFATKQAFSISGQSIVQNYVSKAYVDGSFGLLTTKLNSFALRKNVELSYNDLSGQIIRSFANASASNVDISSITIENIRTPRLTLTSHVLINGDVVVNGDTSSNSLNIANSNIFNNNGYYSVYFSSASATAIMEEFYSKFNNYGSSVLYISADGGFYNLNNSRGALSDSRLKENIVDASPKLEDLLKVRIVDYNLKNNSSRKYIGVLAQELEELFPSLVETESPNAHDIEKGKMINYKSVKYSCFNVMLIKALQEQQQIINNLTLRLERLKGKKEKSKNYNQSLK